MDIALNVDDKVNSWKRESFSDAVWAIIPPEGNYRPWREQEDQRVNYHQAKKRRQQARK